LKINEKGLVRLTNELAKIPSFLREETLAALSLAREYKKAWVRAQSPRGEGLVRSGIRSIERGLHYKGDRWGFSLIRIPHASGD